MGDRTTVVLSVLKSQEADALKHFDASGCECWEHDDQTCCWQFEEVNYGNLEFLQHLRSAGIAYNSSWSAGSEYGPGTEYCRFTEDGLIHCVEVADVDINPSITKLLELIDNPDGLRAFILEHHATTTPPSWDNQEEYGRRHRARMLINS